GLQAGYPGVVGSQQSPTPLPPTGNVSSWLGLKTSGQLSEASGTPSASESGAVVKVTGTLAVKETSWPLKSCPSTSIWAFTVLPANPANFTAPGTTTSVTVAVPPAGTKPEPTTPLTGASSAEKLPVQLV